MSLFNMTVNQYFISKHTCCFPNQTTMNVLELQRKDKNDENLVSIVSYNLLGISIIPEKWYHIITGKVLRFLQI